MAKNKVYVTEAGAPVYGMVAEFDTPAAVYHAAEQVRDQGFRKWDVYAPFPIHGIDEAMGIKRTILPLMVGIIGVTGAGLGYLMQWWISNNYPLVTHGKPFGSFTQGGWESFVPITFELGILFSAFTAIIGMLALNGLPRHNHPLFRKTRFLHVSDDRFMICVESEDERFDPEGTRALLTKLGGTNIDVVEGD